MGCFIKSLIGLENTCAFRYIRCLRYCEYHNNNANKLYHKLLCLYYKINLAHLGMKYKIQIGLNTCGYGLRIMHVSGGGGVLINATSVGNYCGFNSGTLIGNKDNPDDKPIIGDYVAFGPGAKAFGKIEIGNNCFVAANAVVTKSFGDNVVIGGVPAKVISNRNNR